jgi:hypothetical protein
MEDVDDDFEVIDHDPLACRKTVDRRRSPAMLVPQSRFDLVGDRFELGLGAGRANDEEIGEAGNPGEIEDDDVFGFLVRSELGAGRG